MAARDGRYHINAYRFVYENDATHSLMQLPAGDAFAYWEGTVSGGPWVTTFPPSTFLHG